MAHIVPADQIEGIVGVPRHATDHYARVVTADATVYLLHSRQCLTMYDGDLNKCPWSLALDRGLEDRNWFGRENMPVKAGLQDGRLVPIGRVAPVGRTIQYGVQVVWLDPVQAGAVRPGEDYEPNWAVFPDEDKADNFAAAYNRYLEAGPHNGVAAVNRATRWAVEQYGEWTPA